MGYTSHEKLGTLYVFRLYCTQLFSPNINCCLIRINAGEDPDSGSVLNVADLDPHKNTAERQECTAVYL